MEVTIDGFPFRPPLLVRIAGRAMRPFLLGKPFPKGLPLPGESAQLIEPESTTLEAGAARLRAAVERVKGGARMEQASPLLGRLTHEQWTAMHLRHAEHHFGFLHPQ